MPLVDQDEGGRDEGILLRAITRQHNGRVIERGIHVQGE